MGFHAMIVDNLKIPFVTSVLGVEVTVEHIGLGEDNSILAVRAPWRDPPGGPGAGSSPA